MKILVTGGTGFIGSNIVRALVSNNSNEIIITGNESEQKIDGFNGKIINPGFGGINWEALKDVELVFHQAAKNDTTCTDTEEMLFANVYSGGVLFLRLIEQGCKKIVYASSTAVYGNVEPPYLEDGRTKPLNSYGISKLYLDDMAMDIAKEHPDITIVGLRYCNVYGPGESHKGHRASMIYQMAQQMKKGKLRLFKSGEQKRDYIYVDDVVRANLLAAQAKESCVLNCGSGKAVSFNSLVKILNNVLKTDILPEYIDNPYKDKYQNHTECNMSLAQKKIGFIPKINIEEGVRKYFDSGCLV